MDEKRKQRQPFAAATRTRPQFRGAILAIAIATVVIGGTFTLRSWWRGFSLGAATTSETFMGGNLTVRYPMYPFTSSSIESDDIAGQVRINWGRGEQLDISVKNSTITVNGLNYGTIKHGDSIFVNAFDGLFVMVDGEARSPL